MSITLLLDLLEIVYQPDKDSVDGESLIEAGIDVATWRRGWTTEKDPSNRWVELPLSDCGHHEVVFG